MELQNGNFMALVAQQNRKNAKPRILKEYRTVKEYYPWRLLALPALFPGIGLIFLGKALERFLHRYVSGGVFFFVFALIFFAIGVMFMYPSKSDFESCKRYRETFERAEKKGRYFKGEIQGYKVKIGGVIPTGRSGSVPKVMLNYVLEVEFFEDGRNKIIETPEMKCHPNGVLKGTECRVYFYEGKYYVGKFELREKRTDGVTEIPERGM